jgi:hypothetical protein
VQIITASMRRRTAVSSDRRQSLKTKKGRGRF